MVNHAVLGAARTEQDENFGALHWQTMSWRSWEANISQSFQRGTRWAWTWASSR